MGNISDIRKGAVIKHQGDLYLVTNFQFVNPGKGSAFTKTKMKSITSGKGTEITYKGSENVETVDVQRTNMQFLYKNGDMYSFMDGKTYETYDLNEDIVGDDGKYLKEGLEVVVAVYEGRPVAIQLPKKVSYTVVTAPPAVKGDTTSGNITKEVELHNGLKIHAPIFIKEGEEISVNTETGDYSGRVGEN